MVDLECSAQILTFSWDLPNIQFLIRRLNSYDNKLQPHLVLAYAVTSLFFHVQNSYINMVFRSTWKTLNMVKT